MKEIVIELELSVERDDGGTTTHKNRHTCKICNRSFSCGKGYGGHKKIHKMKRTIIMKKEERINVKIPDPKPRYTKCPFCPKTFRTKQGFEEHLKTHDWRTFESTEEVDDEGSSSGGSDDKTTFIDLAKVLPPSWATTAKRGKNTNPSSILPLKKRKVESVYYLQLEVCLADKGKIIALVENDVAESSSTKMEATYDINDGFACKKSDLFGNYSKMAGSGAHRCPRFGSKALLAHNKRHCDDQEQISIGNDEVDLKKAKIVVQKKPLMFDLNQPPPPEAEEQMCA